MTSGWSGEGNGAPKDRIIAVGHREAAIDLESILADLQRHYDVRRPKTADEAALLLSAPESYRPKIILIFLSGGSIADPLERKLITLAEMQGVSVCLLTKYLPYLEFMSDNGPPRCEAVHLVVQYGNEGDPCGMTKSLPGFFPSASAPLYVFKISQQPGVVMERLRQITREM